MKIEHIKKALEGMALQYRSCEGDLRRQQIDCNVREITYRHCDSEIMINDMRNYYETLKGRKE